MTRIKYKGAVYERVDSTDEKEILKSKDGIVKDCKRLIMLLNENHFNGIDLLSKNIADECVWLKNLLKNKA